MTLSQLPWLLGAIALFTGTAMPVVQITVQMLAGPKQLGAAAASVQFSRSIGAAVGTAVVGAVLFATLAALDPDTAGLFARIVQQGPGALSGLAANRVVEVQAEIGLGAVLAWSIPVRRIQG
jgi:hypothetical protein